jgi:hypothetical protein
MLVSGGGETATPDSPDSPAAQMPDTSQTPTNPTDSKDASVIEELRQIKELEGKNIKLVAVYNEVANLAVKNGWEADALTVKELNAADTIIKTFNATIEKPSSAHGADFKELLSLADDITVELDTNIRQRVSSPFASKK